MYDLDKTIKHFESLQKRYTKQHNGKMCERVADALEALYKIKNAPTVFVSTNSKSSTMCSTPIIYK